MRFVYFLLIFSLLPFATASQQTEQLQWSVTLDDGYISTKPIIIDDTVFVRSSGFWSGDTSPKVYAFTLDSGTLIWEYENKNATFHDLSPLLFVHQGKGACGDWPSMLLVGWTTGEVMAFDPLNGNLLWQNQTAAFDLGITGEMAIDGDKLIVPARRGLASFCLANGVQQFETTFLDAGWRNGVLVTDEGYFTGDESGNLYQVTSDGEQKNWSVGDGHIRHTPLESDCGLLIHLQTKNGSSLILENRTLFEFGPSPAIPLQLGDQTYLSTSEEFVVLSCQSGMMNLVEKIPFSSNGEITAKVNSPDDYEIWLPRNTPEGGWGVYSNSEMQIFRTSVDWYGTSSPSFHRNHMVIGNDNGVLMAYYSGNLMILDQGDDPSSSSQNSWFFYGIMLAGAGIIFAYAKGRREWIPNLSLIVLLLAAVYAVPDISKRWSTYLDESVQISENEQWNESWPESWKNTQIVVFELPTGEVAFGGLKDHQSVESLTDDAAFRLGISIEKEEFEIGKWIKSINGVESSGWEFTVDGQRASLGIEHAEIDNESIVRWKMA